jgi:hypothetical protein
VGERKKIREERVVWGEREKSEFKKKRLKNIILIIYGILMGIYCVFYLCRKAKSSLDP